MSQNGVFTVPFINFIFCLLNSQILNQLGASDIIEEARTSSSKWKISKGAMHMDIDDYYDDDDDEEVYGFLW